MAKLTYKRAKGCKVIYALTGIPCNNGCLRGKNYCARHRPSNSMTFKKDVATYDARAHESMYPSY